MLELRKNNILAVFHYIPLHSSPMGLKMGYSQGELSVTEDISERILRLPLFFELKTKEQELIIDIIKKFCINGKKNK